MATFAFALPELGESIESGDVVQVLVAVGDEITAEQSVLELETDKAVVEVPSPVSGSVTAIHVAPGDKAAVGQLIVTLETDGAAAANGAPAPAEPPAEAEPEPPAPPVAAETAVAAPASPPAPEAREARSGAPAAPSVRRLAREIGVDIHKVPGSGPGGRVSADDVKRYARTTQPDKPTAAPANVPAAVTLPDFTRWGDIERRPMNNVRRLTADQMARTWATVPQVTQYDQADITELEQLRQKYAPKAVAAGGRLTITAIVLKVVAAALKRFPQFNASVDMATHEVIYKHYYHVGVAVDTDRGLLVPVIRDVDHKNILTLGVELTQLAERARSRKTSLEEMQGGTFTITNLGGIGGTGFSPILNAPEVAILGMARSRIQPVHADGQFVPRLMLPLSLSYDHRLIDGADGARFLRWVVEALSQPFLLSLEG
ncbi:Dihydrolipoyllysine-residue acetyltransferase component of pyruvate dehydrogenase complex [Geodia barretti]|uniref:Dihydrolipoamide acetyltransferase component of pyruvate dehydrogenase complex n=1 Tax=Geodia barretti TaxID=519541 RepID=A0AA35WWS2_GEOBA|nr:Dihydrolipoyllysine-residue acetyltransferase component of pyruvate dehydrogenase complex [Geodia barretti]